MDDFLHNLRKSSERNYDRRNKAYNNPQYRGPERRGGRDQQRRPYPKRNELQELLSEFIPEIKTLLINIDEGQSKMIEVFERNTDVQERQAEVMETLAILLQQLVDGGGAPQGPKRSSVSYDTDNYVEESYNASSAAVDRDSVVELILNLRADGMTYKEIAQHLENENIPTFSGKGAWHAQTVHKVCKRD